MRMPNRTAIEKIRQIIDQAYRDGENVLWIREIARRTELHPYTVSYYLDRYFPDLRTQVAPGNAIKLVLLDGWVPKTETQGE